MSFIDGLKDIARDVLGTPEPDGHKRTANPPTQTPAPRGNDLAVESKTTYAAESQAASAPTSLNLAERLRSSASSAVPPATLPPHMTAQRTETPPRAEPANRGTVATRARANVYDAATTTPLGTADTLTGTDEAATAARSVQHGIDYYARTFGRDGLDGAGSGVDVLVNDRSTDETGAERFAGNGGYFAMPNADGSSSEAIHFGTGTQIETTNGSVNQQAMQYADDLAIHELTHGIIRKETGHLGGDADESGATNEGIADVMAAAATRDWRIGEGLYGADSAITSMRNIAEPDDPSTVHGLWTSIGQVRENQSAGAGVEEHWASGVVSTAAYRVQQRLGGEAGWQAVEQVFYDTIDNNRLGDMSFNAVAGALRSSAQTLFGPGSEVSIAFDEELQRAGV